MNGQFIKNTLIFIGIIVGLSASGFLLVQELSAVPITYASGVDLSGNFPDKNVTIKNISDGDKKMRKILQMQSRKMRPAWKGRFHNYLVVNLTHLLNQR